MLTGQSDKPSTADLINALPWRYHIGDVVCHKGAVSPWYPQNRPFAEDVGPIRLVVVERLLRQCSAGVQLFYVVTAADVTMVSREHMEFYEVALAPYPAKRETLHDELRSLADVGAIGRRRPTPTPPEAPTA